MILIVGASGNMGRRYGAILDYINQDWVGIDEEWVSKRCLYGDDYFFNPSHITGVIIASPTHCHATHVKMFAKYKVPILCEKPITKDMNELKEICDYLKRENVIFDMVHQYEILSARSTPDITFYDYFKHGGDGLYWDCIQLIGLAKGEIELREQSPIWTCKINGQDMEIAKMDLAYLSMIRLWLSRPRSRIDEIMDYHYKTKELADARRDINSNWHSS